MAIAFNEMLEALEQNHQALERLHGDASCQFRTPLTIRANLHLAKRIDGRPPAASALATIRVLVIDDEVPIVEIGELAASFNPMVDGPGFGADAPS